MVNSNLDVINEQSNGSLILNSDYVSNNGWWNNFFRRGYTASVKISITTKREIPSKTVIATLPFSAIGSYPAGDLGSKGYQLTLEGNTITNSTIIPANIYIEYSFVVIISK